MTHQIIEGDCVEVMASMEENSVDAIVTDPPYFLRFMGTAWDHSPGPKEMQTQHELWAREAFRVLKPGGHMLAFGGTRTYHRLVCAIEDAGFEIRDSIQWLYGSGFPKSASISKHLDKMAGAEREVVGRRTDRAATPKQDIRGGNLMNGKNGSYDGSAITAPATEAAQQWDGWGTALKPAHEPIVLARKPLSESSVARQVLASGTGAINVAATRVGVSPQPSSPVPEAHRNGAFAADGASGDTLRSVGSPFASLESALASLRNVASELRSYSTAYTAPSPSEGAQDDSQPLDASSGQMHLARLYPNGVWCGLNLSEVLGSQVGCPACRRLCDERIQRVQEAAQESPPSLADALDDMCSALSEPSHNQRCEDSDRPSSCGVPRLTLALADLLNRRPSITYSERQRNSGRWPANLLLSHHPDCEATGGVRRVKGIGGGDSTSPYASETTWSTSKTPGQKRKGYSDPDGTEEVAEWICVESCPIRLMDEQSGQTASNARKDKGNFGGAFGNGMPVTSSSSADDKGGSSRFFQQFDSEPGFLYQAKAPRSERGWYLSCNCETVKLRAWARPDLNHSERTALTSHARDIFARTTDDGLGTFITSSGKNATDQSPRDTKSTTSTKTSLTIESKTSSLSPQPNTNESTLDANSETASGGNPAEYAQNSSPSQKNTGTSPKKVGRSTGVAVLATFPRSSLRKNCADCGSEIKAEGHPTQKPIALMRYLCKMITPPGGTVLDPFAGSGSTGCAAVQEGFDFIGIEKEPEYAEIARRRIEHWSNAKDRPKAKTTPKPKKTPPDNGPTLFD